MYVHAYDKWINLREVQDLLLSRAEKRKRPVTLAIYGTEPGRDAIRPSAVDTGIHT